MRFVFDTSVLIDYLRDPDDTAADALFIAAEQGEAFVSLVSLMELWLLHRNNCEIENQVKALQTLCERLSIRTISCSVPAQRTALEVLRAYRSSLGKNALPDSLILATGFARKAWIVTRDKNWSQVSKKVISPEDVVRRF